MTNFVCKTSTCKFLKEGANAALAAEKKLPYRETSAKKLVLCKHCKKAMAEDANAAVQPAQQPKVTPDGFVTATETVKAATQLEERKVYINGVLASLAKADLAFRQAFSKDMRNPAYVKEFVLDARQSLAGVVCVDSALKVCGLALPPGAPKGSKFDWELVYLMQHAKWPLAGKVMQQTFASVVGTIADNEQYVVSTEPDGNGSGIGHTVVLTQLNGELWLSDAQKLTSRYPTHKYTAWKRPGKIPVVDKLNPKRKVDRQSGEFIGAWVER